MLISKCCLLIDDDTFNQEVFSRALNDISPDTVCVTASTAIEGLRLITKENIVPSYIFVELDLPEMNGIEFLKTIKSIARLKEIPVIVHSTSPQPHKIIELKEAGALAIYFRPYEYYGVCNMLTLYFSTEMAVILPN